MNSGERKVDSIEEFLKRRQRRNDWITATEWRRVNCEFPEETKQIDQNVWMKEMFGIRDCESLKDKEQSLIEFVMISFNQLDKTFEIVSVVKVKEIRIIFDDSRNKNDVCL